jgi:hypothetical protein
MRRCRPCAASAASAGPENPPPRGDTSTCSSAQEGVEIELALDARVVLPPDRQIALVEPLARGQRRRCRLRGLQREVDFAALGLSVQRPLEVEGAPCGQHAALCGQKERVGEHFAQALELRRQRRPAQAEPGRRAGDVALGHQHPERDQQVVVQFPGIHHLDTNTEKSRFQRWPSGTHPGPDTKRLDRRVAAPAVTWRRAMAASRRPNSHTVPEE